MSAINQVLQIGRLTRDPEVKYTNNGYSIMKFSIANSYRKKINDQYQDVDQYFDVTILGKYAESLNFLRKGLRVSVSGELRYSTWEDNGAKKSKVEILGLSVECLTPKNNNQNQGGYQNQNQGGYQNQNQGGYHNQNQSGYQNQNQNNNNQGRPGFNNQGNSTTGNAFPQGGVNNNNAPQVFEDDIPF